MGQGNRKDQGRISKEVERDIRAGKKRNSPRKKKICLLGAFQPRKVQKGFRKKVPTYKMPRAAFSGGKRKRYEKER